MKFLLECAGFGLIAGVGLANEGGWPVVFAIIATAGFTTLINRLDENSR